jgi:hypothetical protein
VKAARVKLIDGPLCPGAYSLSSSPEPRAVELWNRWKGKWVIITNPEASPQSWDCGTDVVWDVPEISADGGKLLGVCRHMIEAGD